MEKSLLGSISSIFLHLLRSSPSPRSSCWSHLGKDRRQTKRESYHLHRIHQLYPWSSLSSSDHLYKQSLAIGGLRPPCPHRGNLRGEFRQLSDQAKAAKETASGIGAGHLDWNSGLQNFHGRIRNPHSPTRRSGGGCWWNPFLGDRGCSRRTESGDLWFCMGRTATDEGSPLIALLVLPFMAFVLLGAPLQGNHGEHNRLPLSKPETSQRYRSVRVEPWVVSGSTDSDLHPRRQGLSVPRAACAC